MMNVFPKELAALKANIGSPIDLVRIENEQLRQVLQSLRDIIDNQNVELTKLRELLERRTSVMSPTKGFSLETYHRTGMFFIFDNLVDSYLPYLAIHSSALGHANEPTTPISATALDDVFREPSSTPLPLTSDTGIYEAEDSTLRAFANPSPRKPQTPRKKTQVDLVLPPARAFSKPGK
jgi:hypothetical protein